MTAKEPSTKGGKKTGRPSKFTKALGDEICLRLSEGESLRKICLSDHMPNKSTVFDWLLADKVFHDQYARAREMQADALFDEMLDIADESLSDSYEDDNGNERINHEVVQRSRLRIDTRKWIAGKLRPKVYGDKIETAVNDKSVADELKALAEKLPD
jgi:hypothetical protein